MNNKVRCEYCRKFRAASQLPRHYKSKPCTIARANKEIAQATKDKKLATKQYEAALKRLAADHQRNLQVLDFKIKESAGKRRELKK